MDIDLVLVLFLFSFYLLQEWVMLRQCILWRGDVGLLRGERNEERVLESVEVA